MFYKGNNYKDFPSITLSEIDKSQYFSQAEGELISSKTVAIVGYSEYGEYEKPILVRNLTEKRLKIGNTLKEYPLGGMFVDKVLNSGGNVYFFRIKDECDTKASATKNITTATKSKAEITVQNNPVDLGGSTVTITLKFKINDVVHTLSDETATGSYSLTNFASNVSLAGFAISANANELKIEKNTITENETIEVITDVNESNFFTYFGNSGIELTNGRVSLSINLEAKYYGENGNRYKIILERRREVSVSGVYETSYNFYIYYDNELYQFFKNVDLFDVTSDNYLLTKINSIEEISLTLNGFANYPKEEFDAIHDFWEEYDETENPIPEIGTLTLQNASATNVFNTENTITNFKDCASKMDNTSEAEFRYVLVAYPFANNLNDKQIYDVYVGLCKQRNDCMLLVSTPKDLTETEIQTWANTTYAIDNDFVAVFTNWGVEADSYNKQLVDVPSVYYVISNFLKLPYSWYPVANRNYSFIGINKIDKIWNEKTTMPIFQSGMNIVNPIYKEKDGYYLMGQKTGLRSRTALNRINTRLALIEIEMETIGILKQFLFTYNDADTRNELLRQLNIAKQKYITENAFEIAEYICDETNNTSEIINDNALVLELHLVPKKTAEKILVKITLHEAGWSIEELTA